MPVAQRARSRAAAAWRPLPGETIATAFGRGTANSIGFLRWGFAVLVVVYHGYIVGSMTADPLSRAYHHGVGDFAVLCFFVLSGFLITRSFRNARLVNYLWRRCLRILPAFWGCLVLTAFGFSLVSWWHNHGHSLAGFTAQRPWEYVTHNVTMLHITYFVIPGTYQDTPYTRATGMRPANASLWTLPFEFSAYLVVGLVGIAGLLWARRVFMLGFTGFWAAMLLAESISDRLDPAHPHQVQAVLGQLFHPFGQQRLAELFLCFFAGACFALYADRIRLTDARGIAALLAVAAAGRMAPHGFALVAAVPLGYAILYLAKRLPMAWWDRFGDASYGVYLYNWPVCYLLAELGVVQRAGGIHGYVLVCIATATALGLLSYHLLEKHALRLKDWNAAATVAALSAAALSARLRTGAGASGPALAAPASLISAGPVLAGPVLAEAVLAEPVLAEPAPTFLPAQPTEFSGGTSSPA